MEESSEAHMETDVSSTTDDVPEAPQVSGSISDMEMVVVVETVKEEDESSVDFGSKRSTPSTSTNSSPQKPTTPQKLSKPSQIGIDVSKKMLLSSDSQKTPSKSQISSKTSPVKQQPESSDSPKKAEATVSPGKSPEKTEKSPIKITSVQNVPNSPFKDLKVTKGPIKLIRVREIPKSNVNTQGISPAKDVPNKPDKEVTLIKMTNKEVKLPETSVKSVISPEKTNNQDVLTENSPQKDTNSKATSEKVSESSKVLVSEKAPASVEQQPVANMEVESENENKETNSNLPNSNDDKVQDSADKVSSNEISMSEINDKAHGPDNLPNTEYKTVNGEDKMDSTVPVDELIPTNLNDSQSSMDVENNHNKSISRELKSLIKSAKESKIISECTQLTSKTRKSRSQLDTSNTSLNTSLEVDKIRIRRGSNVSQVSNTSEKSEKGVKRSMRSQNPEFASKCKMFMNSVASKVMKDSDEAMSDDETVKSTEKVKTTMEHSKPSPSSLKKKKVSDEPVSSKQVPDERNKFRPDSYCWRCHWIVEQEENDKAHPPIHCTVCPRSFHYKCLSANERKTATEKSWVCPDCLAILHAEGSDTRSAAMKKTSLGTLCDLLKYALERMMDLNGVEPFLQPVDRTLFPDYDKYVVHPMDLSQMKKNIADGLYGSTEAFIADAQWILHNSIIFNTLQSKLTGGARALVRSCRAEMGEIEACPECYAAAHARRATWFTDVCSTPHILLWAKLKGFPYWPAKAMSVNSSGLVDVRFFGAHDRAWVPAKDCFLFSERDPNNFRSKRQDILDSMQEAEQHIRNISRKYGKFVYPPFKTQFDPSKLTEQLKLMIPSFEGEVRAVVKDKHSGASPLAKAKRRSISKGSKSSANDGDVSENEDTSTSARTEAIKINKNDSIEKDTSETLSKIDSPVASKSIPSIEEPSVTRKRRRSQLEEARVMTVIESSSPVPEKKNKAEKPELQEPSSSKDDKAHSTTKESESTTTKKADVQKSKPKDEEPSSSTQDTESLRVTPIKLVALPRTNKQTPKMFAATKCPSNPASPREEDKTPQKTKPTKPERASTSEKSKEDKLKKRTNPKVYSKSLNGSSVIKTPKTAEKKAEGETTGKEVKPKENKKKETDNDANKSTSDVQPKDVEIIKSTKDRITFDDDTSLAVIARERRRSNANLPTISSVCSLSTSAQVSLTTATPTTSTAAVSQIVQASSNSSIFTPTSTETVRNMKDAVNKLQKLRDNTEPVVGRVGVKAFARMTSPNREKSPQRSDNMEVEIKAEPIDMEEDEVRLNEKMDLMTACKLQPVGQTQNLRNVRISRVVSAAKKVEARPRARKTFPQPRPSEGRSELNGKNSMVYIPIQPPATQPPVRPVRPNAQTLRLNTPASGNNTVNTVITPLKPTTTHSSPVVSVPTVAQVSVPSVGQVSVPTVGQVSVPTVGQVPTTVHTVPLMTSVNGQWMFSLQPVMSVGGVDSSNSGPMVNGTGTANIVPVPVPATAAPGSAATLTPLPNRSATDNTPAELPRLQQRPTLVQTLEGTGGSVVPVPPSAGPITAKIHQNAQKLTDFFRTLIEETIEDLQDPAASATALRMQLEQARWRHTAEVDELKFNHELTLAEMRLSFEKDKLRVANETRRTAQAELDAAVKVAKSKQWCANCTQEAQLYCCWNTAYCDYPCQRAHWPSHYTLCAQRTKDSTPGDAGTTDVQILPEVPALQKSTQTPTPALTVGGKLTRVFSSQDANATQKASIIVSMVEDNSGNQTMKCVGTYKPGAPQGQMPPLILNKQVMADETAKKVVTSGGYLIVGAGNNASLITPAQARRSNTIQYFT